MTEDVASSGTPRTRPWSELLLAFGVSHLRTRQKRQGDSSPEIKIRDYSWGLIVTIAGVALYSYYVRELLAALTLFCIFFLVVALLGLAALLVWCASVQVAIWARPASRQVIAFSRRMIAAYARP